MKRANLLLHCLAAGVAGASA
eukprot:SAG31_NODE_28127_length_415_cov_0.756329_1_plen_20_part_10